MDSTVQFFCSKGIADTSQKIYQSGLRKFTTFCSTYSITTPFPVSEDILCYFASYLAVQGLSPQTIKVYLAGIRHMQISIGLPDPKEFSSIPRLKLVQSGIQRHNCDQHTRTVKIRLPITPAILHKIRDYWLPKSTEPDIKMLWAAVVICFFGFFHSGEITVPSLNSFDPSSHLAWGDVSLDNVLDPTMLKVHLRKSKTDQLKKGVDVYIGKIKGFVSCGSRGRIYVYPGFRLGTIFQVLKWPTTYQI